MECWFSFESWWVPPAVIVTLCEHYLLMTGSFPHSVPFTGSGITWHLKMISHIFMGLSCWFLHFHAGLMPPPRVVHVLGVVVPAFVTAKYVIVGGRIIWVIVRTQEGTVIQVIPNNWVFFRIVWHEEAYHLKPIGYVVIVAPHIGLVEFHMCRGSDFF